MDRTNSYRATQRLHSVGNIVEAGISCGERIINMIGARFDFQRFLEQLNRFGSVVLVELEYSLVVESVCITRNRRRAREALFADRQVRADASYNLVLFCELAEQAQECRLCGGEVLTIERS